jgi:hypothetical protein
MIVMMRDDRFGVAVPPGGAWPDAHELRALGVGCVRGTVTDFEQFEAALHGVPRDVRVIAMLGVEHLSIDGEPAGLLAWDAVVRAFAARFGSRVWALECLSGWNERGLSPAAAVGCARNAGRILREAGAEIVCLLGAATGPDWLPSLQAAARLLSAADRELVRGAAFHLHGRNARGFPGFNHGRYDHGEIDIAVQNAHDVIQLPIWATEFGVPLQQAGGEGGQARYVRDALDLLGALPREVLAAATYFCWQDAPRGRHQQHGHAFGLRRAPMEGTDLAGEPRRGWHTFAAAAGGALRSSSAAHGRERELACAGMAER